MINRWFHVYKGEKYIGFFIDEATAKKWVGRKKGYKITNERPPSTRGRINERTTEPASLSAGSRTTEEARVVDQGLDAALAATEAHKEANHDNANDTDAAS